MVASARLLGPILCVLAATGCLRAKVDECELDVICPRPLVCAPDNSCVVPERLDSCRDRGEQATCVFQGTEGLCLDGLCTERDDIPPFAVDVILSGSGSGQVTSMPAGINCPPVCSATFDRDVFVTLTAAAHGGSAFVRFDTPCAGLSPTCVVKVEGRTTRVVIFDARPPIITGVLPAGGARIGQTITITGENLADATAISFGSIPQPSFQILPSNEIQTVVPAGATTGPISVSTPSGTAQSIAYTIVDVQAVVTAALARTDVSGCVELEVTIRQAQSLPTDVHVEVAQKGAGFMPAHMESDLSGLASSPEGTRHVLLWNSPLDYGGPVHDVTVQVTVGGQSASVDGLSVDNRPTMEARRGSGLLSARITAVAIADVDLDGRPDIVAAEASFDEVAISRGASGDFAPSDRYAAGAAPSALAVGDVDRDGWPDLVVTDLDGGEVTVLLNDGGTFRRSNHVPVAPHPDGLALGDLDGDGRLDLAVTALDGAVVWLLRGHGDGTFAPAVPRPVGSSPRGVTIADLDRNGTLDLAVTDLGAGEITLLFGAGDLRFTGRTVATGSRQAFAIVAADLDDDPGLDLAVATDDGIVVLHNPFNDFRDPEFHGAGSGPSTLAAADFDLDGVADLAANDLRAGQVIIVPGRTDLQASVLSADLEPGALAAGDVDLDGKPDLVAAGDGGGIAIFHNGSPHACGSSFASASIGVESGSRPVAVAITGLDGVRDAPALVTVNRGTRDLTVLIGRPFSDGLADQTRFPLGADPAAVLSVDINRDGKLDLVAAAGPGVFTLGGLRDGLFEPPVLRVSGAKASGLAVGDLDRDGKLDLAVADDAGDSVTVLLGNGDDSFATRAAYPAGGGARSLAVGDLDRDGKLDLAVANVANTVSVFLGRGDGTFAAARTFAAGAAPAGVAIADLDRDGRLDLIVAGEDGLQLLRGMGSVTFLEPLAAPDGRELTALAVADLDLDGAVDVAAVSMTTSKLLLFYGNGDGTLQAPIVRPGGERPRSVAIGDLDGDIWPDLAVAATDDSEVRVFYAR